MTQIYHVAIVGAGAVGSAIARELSPYELDHEFRKSVALKVVQGQRVLYRLKFRQLLANTSIGMSSKWTQAADFAGEPLKIEVVEQ
jgi:hypothetical protein